MTERHPAAGVRRGLTRNAGLIVAAVVLGVLIALMASNGGFPATTWYPGALVLLGVLYLALVALPARGTPPRPVIAAIALLAAYVAWSYLSITWAGQKADAWDGANRTAFYAAIFAAMALWPLRREAAALVVGAFGLAVAALALAVLLGAHASPNDFLDGRLAAPVGYSNATVALWTMGMFPCIALGSRRELAPPLRALMLAAAVVLAGAALMGQSRGWLFALPPAVLIYIAVSRDRVRAAFAVVGVLAAGLIFRAPVLNVYTAISRQSHPQHALDSAIRAILLAALALAAAVIVIGYADRRWRLSSRAARGANRGFAIAAVLAAALVLIVVAASAGHPVARLENAWNDFKRGPEPSGAKVRFGQSLGSQRYDFWRVALKEFAQHPVVGIGADNFQETYLRLRHSDEEPFYPHSTEFRALLDTGVVGGLLLAGAIVAALWAAGRAMRRRAGLGAAAATGAVATFAYWLFHSSVDWLWEFPALAGSAFALLGLAAGLAPRRGSVRVAAPLGRPAAVVAGSVCALLIALSFASPYLAARDVAQASRTWPRNVPGALDQLHTASRLNPLSPLPALVAGSIALRLGAIGVAERNFHEAIKRDPANEYARFELGLIAGGRHNRASSAQARTLLAQALALNPRDDLAQTALRRVEAGRLVDVAAFNRTLVNRAKLKLR